jgi:general stress protein 26
LPNRELNGRNPKNHFAENLIDGTKFAFDRNGLFYFKTYFLEKQRIKKFMTETRAQTIEKLNLLIKDISIAMVTTVDKDVLRSRPMATQEPEFDGELWFFTSRQTHKAEDIEKDNRVNVSFSAPEDNRYVSMSGTAEVVDDREKIEELWSPTFLARFPKGLEDPNITHLNVSVDQAEYWDATSSSVVEALGLLKSLVTGERPNTGDYVVLSLN